MALGGKVEEALGAPVHAYSRPAVLVVEDEVLIRLMIAEDLMQAGFQVVQCATADEAWTVLQSSLDIGLVLTDVRMPGALDGLALALRIRLNLPHIKIVIGSGQVIDRSIADAVLVKPFTAQALIACVQQLLEG
jgi:CheY-like chemotaxis protein